MLRSFFEVFRSCINLVFIISEEVSDFPRKSAGEVSQNCHKVGMPPLFKAALTQGKPALYNRGRPVCTRQDCLWIAKKMKDVPTDTPFIFFHWLICVSPFQDFVGVMAMLICSAGHDRPSRACSAPSSMPNDLKYKAIVAESYRGVQVENASSPREPAYPFISSYP